MTEVLQQPARERAHTVERDAISSWYTLAALIVAYVFAFLDRQILSLLVEPLERDLHISDTQMSLLQGFVFALFLALAGLPLGRLVDTRRRTAVAAMGLACWSAMTAACGLVSSYRWLMLFRVGVSAGEASLTPAAHSIIADTFPPRRLGLALGIYGLGTFVGAGLALVIGGVLIGHLRAQGDVTLPFLGAIRPWQLVFLIIGVAGLPVALWLAALHEPQRDGIENDAHPTLQNVLAFFCAHFAAIALLDMAAAFVAMSAYAASAWVPTYLIRDFGWTAAQAGTAYGLVFMLCGVAGVVCGGALSDWAISAGRTNGRVTVIAATALAAAPFAAATSFTPDGGWTIAVLIPLTLFSTMAIGIVPAAQQAMMPSRMRGVASALGVLVVNLIGLGAGPTVVALLTDDLFGDKAAVGFSLSLSLPVMLITGAILAVACRGPYRRALTSLAGTDICQ